MANKLNKIFCGTDAKNTGVCDCFMDPKLLTGGILIPRNRVLTQAELDDIQATLEGLSLETKANRIFPIQNFVAVTDNSEDPTNQTFGYGSIEPVREGNYNLVFQFRQGGLNLSNALRSFNGLTGKYALLLIENQNHLIGTLRKDSNGENGMAGIPLEVLYTFPWKPNDGSNLSQYRIQFGFQPQWVNENVAYIKVPATTYMLSSITGLEDIVLRMITDAGGAELVIGADTECGTTDVYDLYDDELAQTVAWRGFDEDGAAIAVNSVTKNTVSKGWTVVFASRPATVELAPAATLAAAPINVVGYESSTLEVEAGS